MINEDFVSFETAKLLKEKGFDERGMYHYTNGDTLQRDIVYNQHKNSEMGNAYSAPTLQMAMKWLREVHNLFIEIRIGNSKDEFWYDYDIIPINEKEIDWKNYKEVPYIECYSYEEACEAAIKYCLENLI